MAIVLKRKPRKIDENALRGLWKKKWSDTQIAELMGVSKSGVSAARNRLGLPSNYIKNPESPDEIHKRRIKRAREWKRNNPEKVKAHSKAYYHEKVDKKEHALRMKFFRKNQKRKLIIDGMKIARKVVCPCCQYRIDKLIKKGVE